MKNLSIMLAIYFATIALAPLVIPLGILLWVKDMILGKLRITQ